MLKNLFWGMILLLLLASCGTSKKTIESKAYKRLQTFDHAAKDKITTLLSMIDEQSMLTDPGAKHYVPYEFVIPLDEKKRRRIRRIDRSVYFTKRSQGYQCIGDNATKENVLHVLSLPYTQGLKFCPFE